MKVTDNVYRVASGFVNQYFIVGPDGLTLIDTGIAGNGKRILKAIEEIGERPERLKKILITHADGDHFGALSELVRVTGAQVFAAKIEADAIQAGISSRPLIGTAPERMVFNLVGKLFKPQPAQVDEIIEPGQTLTELGGLEVLDSSGHTPGHLSFYAPAQKVLFAGDSIRIAGGKLVPSAGVVTWNQEKAQQAFERQVALHPIFYCCGHGYFEASGE